MKGKKKIILEFKMEKLEKMRSVGKIVADILRILKNETKPGMTGKNLEKNEKFGKILVNWKNLEKNWKIGKNENFGKLEKFGYRLGTEFQ